MKRVATLILTVAVTLGCGGCQRQGDPVRDRMVVTAIAVEERDGSFRVTVQAVESLKTAAGLSEQQENATSVYTADGASVSDALAALAEQKGRKVYVLQNRLLAIGEAGCRTRSLSDMMGYFWQDCRGMMGVPVCAVRGETETLLSARSGDDPIQARYAVSLLRQNAKQGRVLYRTVLDAARAQSGMWDAVLPMLTVKGETVEAGGTLVFRNGIAVGELDASQTVGLSLLAGEAESVRYTVDGVTYDVTPTKVKTAISSHPLSVVFTVGCRVRATEVTGDAVPRAQAVAGEMRGQAESALARLDELKSDPLGLARKAALQGAADTQKTALSQLFGCDKTVVVEVVSFTP